MHAASPVEAVRVAEGSVQEQILRRTCKYAGMRDCRRESDERATGDGCMRARAQWKQTAGLGAKRRQCARRLALSGCARRVSHGSDSGPGRGRTRTRPRGPQRPVRSTLIATRRRADSGRPAAA